MSASDSVTPGLYSEALVRQTLLLRSERKPALRLALVACERIADFASAAIGIATALLLSSTKPHLLMEIIALSTTGGFLAVLDLGANHAYAGGEGLLQIRETERAISASVRCSLFLIPILLVTSGISKSAILLAPIAIAVSLILQKQCFLLALRAIDRTGNGGDRVVVYGARTAERRVVSTLLNSVRLGLRPVAVIDDTPDAVDGVVLELGYRDRSAVPVVAAPIAPELLDAYGCTTLIVATDGLSVEEIETAAQCARVSGAKVALASARESHLDTCPDTRLVDGLVLSMHSRHTWTGLYEASKRVLDVALSSIALVGLLPIFVLIAVLIKLDSAGPVLFIQNRVGLNGRIFSIFKFRSMYAESEKYQPSPTSSLDPRLTTIGRLLRRLSLDELPQLVNVIRGEMSLVGPRPEMPFIVQKYDSSQRMRLSVRPGITGLWQLSADRAFPIHENLEYDLYYVRNRGWFMDVAILFHTVLFAMRGGI
ncbi:MAG: exopolysaccharide biosynthesis polyprenyl glycosylphosphotransferase [Acidobacteria bacterium]|nr:exopolysaccharide biosynthesis polyprenyl glycosylphosphotransferase [Acidobacteriota bacterium]